MIPISSPQPVQEHALQIVNFVKSKLNSVNNASPHIFKKIPMEIVSSLMDILYQITYTLDRVISSRTLH